MKLDDCMQEQCAHCPLNQIIKQEPDRSQLLAMCPVCVCGAPPHYINTECKSCLECENVPNKIRGGNNIDGLMQDQIVEVVVPPEVMQEILIEKQIGDGR